MTTISVQTVCNLLRGPLSINHAFCTNGLFASSRYATVQMLSMLRVDRWVTICQFSCLTSRASVLRLFNWSPYNRKTHRFSPSSIGCSCHLFNAAVFIKHPREPYMMGGILEFLFNSTKMAISSHKLIQAANGRIRLKQGYDTV